MGGRVGGSVPLRSADACDSIVLQGSPRVGQFARIPVARLSKPVGGPLSHVGVWLRFGGDPHLGA